MPQVVQDAAWSVEIPGDWTVERRTSSIAADLPEGAELHFTTFDPTSADLTASKWTEVVAHVNRRMGRPVRRASFGDFRGYETWFIERDMRIHGWALAAGALPLDVTYRGPEAQAERHIAQVSDALATLRRAAV